MLEHNFSSYTNVFPVYRNKILIHSVSLLRLSKLKNLEIKIYKSTEKLKYFPIPDFKIQSDNKLDSGHNGLEMFIHNLLL